MRSRSVICKRRICVSGIETSFFITYYHFCHRDGTVIVSIEIQPPLAEYPCDRVFVLQTHLIENAPSPLIYGHCHNSIVKQQLKFMAEAHSTSNALTLIQRRVTP